MPGGVHARRVLGGLHARGVHARAVPWQGQGLGEADSPGVAGWWGAPQLPPALGARVPGTTPEGVPGAGGDGGAGGGEPAGSQRHAEDGPALLLRSLAALQRQVRGPSLPARPRGASGTPGTTDTRLLPSSLHRYKHPSEEELCALAGKQRPKAKRDRSAQLAPAALAGRRDLKR